MQSVFTVSELNSQFNHNYKRSGPNIRIREAKPRNNMIVNHLPNLSIIIPLTPALMKTHPHLCFLSPLRERIRGEGASSSEREKGRGCFTIEGLWHFLPLLRGGEEGYFEDTQFPRGKSSCETLCYYFIYIFG